jgi:hypothetical protein
MMLLIISVVFHFLLIAYRIVYARIRNVNATGHSLALYKLPCDLNGPFCFATTNVNGGVTGFLLNKTDMKSITGCCDALAKTQIYLWNARLYVHLSLTGYSFFH